MDAILIGTGMVAATHLLALRDNTAGVRLAGIIGRNPTTTQTFAANASATLGYPVPVLPSTRDAQADMAIVLTPPDARAEPVAALAQRGIPILMEKPIERDLARATAIVETCERADTPLGIVFQHRTRAASRALAQTLAAGTLGQIATAEIRVPWWRDQTYYDAPGRGTYARDGGGVMINQAIHTLDLALSLLGPVVRVQAMMHQTPLHRLEAEDWAGALLQFQNGCVATLHASTAAFPGHPESLTLHGTSGAAHLTSGVLTLTLRDGSTQSTGEEASTGGGADPMAFTHAWHQSVLEEFATAIRDNRPPPISGRDALSAHVVMDAMERAAKSGRAEDIQP